MPRQMIWIMTDTTGYNMVGCYGFPQMNTPHMDDIARHGVRFERAYTCQPVCGPARSALFTGLYPHSNGSWGNSMPLGADVKTLGQRLSADGVACGYIGKWHLDGGDYFGNGICPDGWDPDYWYDMKNYLDELSDADKLLSRTADPLITPIAEEFTFGYRVTQRALKFIEAHRDKDFFLVVSYDEPHDPGLCPEPYASMYRDVELPKNAAHFDTLKGKPLLQKLWGERNMGEEAMQRPIKFVRLLGCNSYADDLIGRVMAAARTQAPDALKLFTSDHGDAMDAHRLYAKGPCIYDEIARVPLMMEGPGITAGTVYPHTVSHIDLPATVLDWFKLARPVMLEGRSLLAQARDVTLPTRRPAFVEFARYEINHDGFGGFQPMRAVVTDTWRLALHLVDTDELYNIADDPHCMHNRINDPACADIRNQLHDSILDWMNETRDPFRGYQWQARPWRPDKKPSWNVDDYIRHRENDPGEYRQKDYSTGLPIVTATWRRG